LTGEQPAAAGLAQRQPHRSDLLQLGDDDFLSHAPEWLIASVTEFGLRHLNGTLMVGHHHRHKVGIDIARRPDRSSSLAHPSPLCAIGSSYRARFRLIDSVLS
jgi:hypothetical protein